MKNNMRKIRKERGMTIEELAEIAKVSAVYIYHLENGTRDNPSYGVMRDIARGLETTIEAVFGE